MGLGKLDNYQFVVINFSCAGFLLFKQPDHCLMISPVLYDTLSAHTVQLLNDEELATGRDRFWVNLALTINDSKHLYTLDNTDTINALTFSPNRFVAYSV